MSLSDLVTAVFSPSRQLGPYTVVPSGSTPLTPFSAQVTIEEVHMDELVITEHPVEYGASITDHAYKKPAELLLKLGWSNSGVAAALSTLSGIVAASTDTTGGDFNYMRTMYQKLLTLQESRIPFNVTTGKRQYTNMLIRSLTVPTQDTTEHALLVTMVLRQILIVNTQTVTATSAAVQTNPQSNAPTTNLGTQQPAVTAFVLNTDGSIGAPVGLHQ